MKAEKLHAGAAPEMTNWQRLNPDVVYRFNELFGEMWRTKRLHKLPSSSGDEKIAYVVPAFLSKSTRTFHWLTVHHTMWTAGELAGQGQSNSDAVDCLNKAVSALKCLKQKLKENELRAFLADLPDHVLRGEMTDTIERLLSHGSSLGRDEHHALLWMYSGYHQSIRKHLEGILYKCLECSKTDSSATYFRGLAKKADPSHDEVDWFAIDREQHACDVSMANSGGASATTEVGNAGEYREYRVRAFESCHGVEYSADTEAEAKTSAKRYWKSAGTARETSERIARTLMIHLLASPNNFGERFAKFEHVALVPLFDHWIGGQGYGGIKAAFILAFTDSKTCTAWLESYLKSPTASVSDAESRSQRPNFEGSFALADAFADLAASVAESAQTLAVASNIEPPYDLMEHFLSVLKFVQDWESAVVFRNGTFQYGYLRRAPNGTSNKWGWHRSEKRKDFDCLEEVLESEEIATVGTRRFLWWTASKPNLCLWNKAFLPSLGDQEATAYGSCAIRFEFPKVARVPPQGTSAAARLREAYLREQLELMRRLIPVVRARRNALRTAAVSIIARNMSHNIGSHVLAAIQRDPAVLDIERGAGHESTERTPREFLAGQEKFIKGIATLQAHLQRRMDFIAELSTAESFYSPARRFFRDVLGLSDGELGGLKEQSLLLQHISGREVKGVPFGAEVVKTRSSKDWSISCAGGSLGEQAIYVIIENIIRNSAKHSPEDVLRNKASLRLFLKVEELDDFPEYLTVRVWDVLGQALAEKEKGKPTPLVAINDDLGWNEKTKRWTPPALIEQTGAIVRKNWGLREMYIAASYLREIPLDSLEARVAEGPSTVIKAIAVDNCGNPSRDMDANLGYEFYLPKAKSLALVFDDADSELAALRKNGGSEASPGRFGIKLFTVTELREQLLGGRSIRHRDLIWLADEESLPNDGVDRPRLPRRVYCESRAGCANDWRQFKADLYDRLRSRDAFDAVTYARERILAQHCRTLKVDKLSVIANCSFKSSKNVGVLNQDHEELVRALRLNSRPNLLVFDYHGQFWEYDIKGARGFPNDTSKILKRLAMLPYYEVFRSKTPQNLLLDDLFKEHTKDMPMLENELKCIAGTAVVILDERVQRAASRLPPQNHLPVEEAVSEHNGFSLRECLARTGVFVPSEGAVNLEHPDVDKLIEWIQKVDTENCDAFVKCGKVEYVVVHQTILDKLGATAPRLIKAVSRLNGAAAGCELVLCSGRGIPTQAYHDTFWPRFVPISSLLEHTVNRPSKAHLVSLLEASRAPQLR